MPKRHMQWAQAWHAQILNNEVDKSMLNFSGKGGGVGNLAQRQAQGRRAGERPGQGHTQIKAARSEGGCSFRNRACSTVAAIRLWVQALEKCGAGEQDAGMGVANRGPGLFAGCGRRGAGRGARNECICVVEVGGRCRRPCLAASAQHSEGIRLPQDSGQRLEGLGLQGDLAAGRGGSGWDIA